MTPPDPTRVAPNPSDSVLLTLARAAMAPDTTLSESTWPHLDLNDAAQREFGDYELLEEIGRGGMGVVYRARQRSLDRDVAIKFIAAGIADSFNVSRFLGEARAAARLLHPNIVPVHEVGSIDGVHYFSMPLIRGRTLANLLDDGTLAPAAATTFMLKLCDAIGYAHRLGLLHLDLKPANVLLDERGEPLITDFGLARHMDANNGVDAQEVSGTPSFMAPEQILIKQYRLTPATDLYALGAILYRALAGVSPHGEGLPDELTQRAVSGRVRPLREINPAVPADLAAITMKCLELLPKDRYASVADLADDLRRVRDGLPVTVRPIGIIERVQRWIKREPKLAMASCTSVFALVMGMTTAAWQWQEARDQRDAAITQRDTAQGVAALGAWLYARQQFGEIDTTGGYVTAMQMLEWLRAKFPGDEHRQATVLTTFATATKDDVDDAALGNRWRTDSFLMPLVHVLGKPYRDRMIEALIAGEDNDRYLLAARLSWNNEEYARHSAQNGTDQTPIADARSDDFSVHIKQAIATQPGNPEVWETLTIYCATTGTQTPLCRNHESARRLTELAPDNAYYWLLLMMESEGDSAREALHFAAQQGRLDDTYRSRIAGYLKAIERSKISAPEILAGPAGALSPNTSPEFAIAAAEVAGLTLVSLQPFLKRCDPDKGYFKDATAYTDCRNVGVLMARSKGSVLTLMIGANVARRLANGTPLEQEMLDVRRQYLYLQETIGKLSMRQYKSYPLYKFHDDYMTQGEQGAWENMVAYYGLPPHPTREWQPAIKKVVTPSE